MGLPLRPVFFPFEEPIPGANPIKKTVNTDPANQNLTEAQRRYPCIFAGAGAGVVVVAVASALGVVVVPAVILVSKSAQRRSPVA
jgi:hypothetical protein